MHGAILRARKTACAAHHVQIDLRVGIQCPREGEEVRRHSKAFQETNPRLGTSREWRAAKAVLAEPSVLKAPSGYYRFAQFLQPDPRWN